MLEEAASPYAAGAAQLLPTDMDIDPEETTALEKTDADFFNGAPPARRPERAARASGAARALADFEDDFDDEDV